MAERGIEIHAGKVVIPAGQMTQFHLGTEAVPITQTQAGQVVISAAINAIALGEAVKAGEFIIVATVNLTGVLIPLVVKAVVNDGITVTPTGGAHTDTVFGAKIEMDVLSAGIVGGRMEGLRIEMGTALGSTTQSAFNGIFISNTNLGTQSAENYYMLRMQENGTYVVHTMFYLRAGTGGVTYFGILVGSHPAWRAFGTVSTPSGFIKVNVAGVDKHIQLYNTED